MRSVLADTGPLVALFTANDRHHARFRAQLKDLARRGLVLMTTWPCVVEATHLTGLVQRLELLRWVGLGGCLVYPFEAQDLGPIVEQMARYSDARGREMDFADASLWWLAAQTGVTDVMTTDVADFSRYRLPDGRAFTLL